MPKPPSPPPARKGRFYVHVYPAFSVLTACATKRGVYPPPLPESLPEAHRGPGRDTGHAGPRGSRVRVSGGTDGGRLV